MSAPKCDSLVGALADHGGLGGADGLHERLGPLRVAARHRRDLLPAVEATRVGLRRWIELMYISFMYTIRKCGKYFPG